MGQQQVSHEGAHHVLGTMGKVDDVEHPEDYRKPEAKQRVKRAVYQSKQQLPKQSLRRYAKNFNHQLATLPTLDPQILMQGGDFGLHLRVDEFLDHFTVLHDVIAVGYR